MPHPGTDETQLTKIRMLLAGQPRNRLLLEMMLQTRATVQDILALKISDLEGLDIGAPLPLNARAGEGYYIFSDSMKNSFDKYLEGSDSGPQDFIFQSNKGSKALSKTSASRLVRKWIADSGIKCSGLRGLRSLTRLEDIPVRRSEKQNVDHTPYTPPRINPMTRQEAVFQELEKAIISGRIRPGQKLSAEEIARNMGVSRIPVREAMGRLEARGLISSRPKWGSVANELSRENLREASEIRLLLEPQAAAKAVRRVNEEFLSRLAKAQAAFARARKGAETSHLLKTNRHFHFLIYEQADSPMLLDLINQIWDKVSPYYHIMFRQSLDRSPTVGVSYHEHVFDSLKKQDENAVQHWLRADLIDSTKFILKLFDRYAESEKTG